MKEMGGHAEEIQTNIAMFASQIHKKKERETVNTDMQTAIQKTLEAWLSPGSATELHRDTYAHKAGTSKAYGLSRRSWLP